MINRCDFVEIIPSSETTVLSGLVAVGFAEVEI